MEKYDFSGWATRNNLKCSDGRVIMRDAFKDCDGKTVPLVWNHQHNDPFNVLGHALLENRDEGVYAYCKFNDTELGKNTKLQVEHGDINALSIYANKLKQNGSNVIHGMIRELSLVLAGANPGAFIDSVIMHGEESDEEAIIYTGEDLQLAHADDEAEEFDEIAHADDKKEGDSMADEKKPENDTKDDKTVQDVLASMSEEEKTAVAYVVGKAFEDGKKSIENDDNTKEDESMKHNVFDKHEETGAVLSHSELNMMVEAGRELGTLKKGIAAVMEENELQHDAVSSGFDQSNLSDIMPDWHDVRPGAPELITNDQTWIGTIMNKVTKTPFSRIRTGQVDIRKIDELRARGYKKGKEKKLSGNYNLVRRTTEPQTVYVKSALHRDDIIDITDFDIVNYQYQIDKQQLREELAMAVLLGDGRDEASEDKIFEDKIRPIWTDDDLYVIRKDLDIAAAKKELQGTDTGVHFGDNYVYAEAMINTVLYAREDYKGSGTPDMFITPHMLNVMLLARDLNGRRIYSSKAELAAALNVNSIITVEQFADKTRKDDEQKQHKLLAMIVNLKDYTIGSTKGGEITHFTDFDIDFNQHKSLLETRLSGALTRCWSAIVIEEPVTSEAF